MLTKLEIQITPLRSPSLTTTNTIPKFRKVVISFPEDTPFEKLVNEKYIQQTKI